MLVRHMPPQERSRISVSTKAAQGPSPLINICGPMQKSTTVCSTLQPINDTKLRSILGHRYTCVQIECIMGTDGALKYFPTWTALQHHIRTVHPPTCSHVSCNGRVFTSQKGLRAHQKLHQQRDFENQIEATVVYSGDENEDDSRPAKKRRGGEIGRDWKCDISDCGKDFKSVS